MKSEKARDMLKPLLDAMMENLGAGGETRTDTAESAISADMLNAMLQYSPLRAMLSFAAGQVSYEELESMVEALNRK